MIKRIVLNLMLLMILPISGLAYRIVPILDQVMYQTSAEQWVSTHTAKVVIHSDLVLRQQEIAAARKLILDNLQRVAKGEWYVTDFRHTQDSSGVERLSVTAEARVSESSLSDVYGKAATISTPGAKYTVVNLDFTPSLAEMETLRESLRSQLYQAIKRELSRLNQTYPEQPFNIHQIDFTDGLLNSASQARNKRFQPRAMLGVSEQSSSPFSLSVSNKIVMQVAVIFATRPSITEPAKISMKSR